MDEFDAAAFEDYLDNDPGPDPLNADGAYIRNMEYDPEAQEDLISPF